VPPLNYFGVVLCTISLESWWIVACDWQSTEHVFCCRHAGFLKSWTLDRSVHQSSGRCSHKTWNTPWKVLVF